MNWKFDYFIIIMNNKLQTYVVNFSNSANRKAFYFSFYFLFLLANFIFNSHAISCINDKDQWSSHGNIFDNIWRNKTFIHNDSHFSIIFPPFLFIISTPFDFCNICEISFRNCFYFPYIGYYIINSFFDLPQIITIWIDKNLDNTNSNFISNFILSMSFFWSYIICKKNIFGKLRW